VADLELEEGPPAEGEAQPPSSDTPDPEGAANRLLERDKEPAKKKRGRPPGRKTGSGGSAAASAKVEIPQGPPTEAEIQGVSMVWGLLWSLVAVRMGNLKPITEKEQRDLSEATIPVLRKYMPAAAEWGPEIALVSCVGFMVVTHLPAQPQEISSGD